MSNQHIYLKGKLVGPVEMEEPTKPDPLAYSQMHRAEYSRDLYHYEENLKIYREYLESLPSIEVHESLKSKLVENGRYEFGRDFVFAKQFIRLISNIPNVGFDEVVAIPIPESTTAAAPQPERLFTIQEMKECWNAGEVYGRTDAYWNCGKSTTYEIENTPDREEYFAIKFKIKPSDIQ